MYYKYEYSISLKGFVDIYVAHKQRVCAVTHILQRPIKCEQLYI